MKRMSPVRKALVSCLILLAMCIPVTLRAATGLEKLVMPGAVAQAHADIEGECEKCHVSFDKAAQPKVCLGCHDKIARDIQQHVGMHGRLSEAQCRTCHTEHKGRTANITVFDRKAFDHETTDFPLLGKHLRADCASCHAAGTRFRDAASECSACHGRDDVHSGRLGTNCAQCHGSVDWKVRAFDHSLTKFALGGRHSNVECTSCHTKPFRTQQLAPECASCHRKDDKHRGSLGNDCQQCHLDTGWRDLRFDHQKTGFALVGRHARTECKGCHADTITFKGAPTTCIGCHRNDDKHANTLGNACETCHQPGGWKPSIGFDHRKTGFPLAGKHMETTCKACHADARHFRDTSTECISCHRKDDTHKGSNGTLCADCHGSSNWKESHFDHDTQTSFLLRGAHRKTTCEACHKSGSPKADAPDTCDGCHEKDDPHKGSLGKLCTSCHDENAWKPAHFDHDKIEFVLLGAHRTIACAKCHASQRYRDAPDACQGCHEKDDAHKGALGTNCVRCHNTRDWRLGEFDHGKETGFALQGGHARLGCNKCHLGSTMDSPHLASDCVSCHSGDDKHEGAFGRKCERCHTTRTFTEILK